ncbi:MAG: T9SS type A sorting domain-containing protein, partial [Saprospiraceae bacterium]|nr:T9SS type A sorting domain-containing protein [Saprospiraceae bacterium]
GGCDSLVNLTLNILPLTEGSENVSICAGESYLFNGEELSASGVYTAVLTGENGCDSTAVLTLTVLPVQSTTIDATVCANEGYPFNGALLTDSGTYTATLTGENGCDSTVVLNLTVLPVYTEAIQVTICANDSYDFEGGIYSDAGIYEVTYQGANGCDSTLVLELSVLPLATSSSEATICAGEEFEYNGTVLTETGVYEFVYPGLGANGCDSIEVLTLTVLPAVPVTTLAATLCDGEVYNYNGEELTEQGVYSFNYTAQTGCDSIVVLNLNVNPVVETSVTASICEGEVYLFGGQVLTDAGTYIAVFQTTAGCDSTVTLSLLINTVNTNVIAQGNTLISQAANATYQWINCANNLPIAGATGNTYTPAQTGNYAVLVTQNGCAATSNCVFVQIVSTKEVLTSTDWSIQPNPASQVTRLVFESPLTEELWMEIHDLSGRSLYQKQLPAGAEAAEILLNELPTGVLFVRLSNQDAVSVKRLIKAAE